MSVSRFDENPLRPAEHLLLWAFTLSIAAHLVILGGFEAGQRLGWWKKDLLPSWVKHAQQSLAEIKKAQQQKQQPPVLKEPPLLFIEVDPSQATTVAPKNAKYYSSQNSQAANPDLTLDTDTPKIDGRQTHVPKTETTPRSKAVPLQPSPPKNSEPPQKEQAEQESKPKPKGGPQIGDLTMAKPAPQPGDGQAETDPGQSTTPVHVRPRTLSQAEAQKRSLEGEKMKQDGGVNHLRISSSVDTLATPFGEYDRELIEAIDSHWKNLLLSGQFAQDHSGSVVIEFHLTFDGRITDLKVVDSNVGDLLSYVCQSAITEPAPYAKWSPEMRRLINGDYREIRFTFYYE
jgi:outer membrane biosynthesis protein TonB